MSNETPGDQAFVSAPAEVVLLSEEENNAHLANHYGLPLEVIEQMVADAAAPAD